MSYLWGHIVRRVARYGVNWSHIHVLDDLLQESIAGILGCQEIYKVVTKGIVSRDTKSLALREGAIIHGSVFVFGEG